MSATRKFALRRLLYIALCISAFFIATYFESIFEYIAVPAVIVGCINTFLLLANLNNLIDDFYPIKQKEKKASKKNKFINNIVMGIFMLGLIAQIFDGDQMDNTVFGMAMFWKFGIIGILSAFPFLYLLNRANPSVFHESERRLNMVIGLPLGLFFLFSGLASIYNHYDLNTPINCQNYEVLRKSTDSKERQYYLFLDFGKGEERLIINPKIWNQLEEKGMAKICTQKGNLGYDYVVEIFPENPR